MNQDQQAPPIEDILTPADITELEGLNATLSTVRRATDRLADAQKRIEILTLQRNGEEYLKKLYLRDLIAADKRAFGWMFYGAVMTIAVAALVWG